MSVDDPPHSRIFESTQATKKTSELKEAYTELGKTITGVVRMGQRTPLTKNPLKQDDAVPPNVSRLLKVADLKSKYIQQIKDLFGLGEVGALSQEGDFDQQKGIVLGRMALG